MDFEEEKIKRWSRYTKILKFVRILDEPIESSSFMRIKSTGKLTICYFTYQIDRKNVYVDVNKKHYKSDEVENVIVNLNNEYPK